MLYMKYKCRGRQDAGSGHAYRVGNLPGCAKKHRFNIYPLALVVELVDTLS